MELSQGEPYQIPKVTFSKEVCPILDAVYIEGYLREGHRLRAEFGGLKQISDYRLINYALHNYARNKQRKLMRKLQPNIKITQSEVEAILKQHIWEFQNRAT
jgi:hypothetical protein